MEVGGRSHFFLTRRARQFVAACCLSFVFGTLSGCLLTSAAGIRPQGALKGYEVREQIKRVVAINVFIGSIGFCSERNHLTDFNCGQLVATDTIFAAERAASIALLIVELDNEAFYTPGSVKSCLSSMALRTLFFTDAYLSSQAECSRSTNTCTLDRTVVPTAATRAALLAGAACSLKPTGAIFSLENTTL